MIACITMYTELCKNEREKALNIVVCTNVYISIWRIYKKKKGRDTIALNIHINSILYLFLSFLLSLLFSIFYFHQYEWEPLLYEERNVWAFSIQFYNLYGKIEKNVWACWYTGAVIVVSILDIFFCVFLRVSDGFPSIGFVHSKGNCLKHLDPEFQPNLTTKM